MFNNELMADVHFIVGPVGAAKKVPAHKVCRISNSPLFPAWLEDGMSTRVVLNSIITPPPFLIFFC